VAFGNIFLKAMLLLCVLTFKLEYLNQLFWFWIGNDETVGQVV